MALILSLETSTKNCSVAVAKDAKLLSLVEESSDQYIHSEKLHLFIKQALTEAGQSMAALEAVAVGKGPGSYTGLRIGVSAAKGICYALQLPLLSVDGLQTLVEDFLSQYQLVQGEEIVPMLDARRMEVYCSRHDHEARRLQPIHAEVVDENSFSTTKASRIHFIGDATAKCREVLTDERFVLHEPAYPSAATLAVIAEQVYREKRFEDLAYFEPFYLKDFVAGKPRKLL